MYTYKSAVCMFLPLSHLLDFDLKPKPHLPSTLLLFVIFIVIILTIVLSIENVIRSITKSNSQNCHRV